MRLERLAGAWRAMAATKDTPTLYDVCDPVFAKRAGDPHLRAFYKTALNNPPLRLLLRGAGLPELRDGTRLDALRAALVQARDAASPGRLSPRRWRPWSIR